MSHRDSDSLAHLNAGCLQVALGWLLHRVKWADLTFRADCTWTPRLLSIAALLWAWSDELTLIDRFQAVRKIVLELFPRTCPVAESYQAFMKMLARWTAPLLEGLLPAFRRRMQQDLAHCWQVRDWVMFGVDGSRMELPRTRSHEQAYSAIRKHRKARRKDHFKKSNSPQLWLTTMWHAGSGLPWDWRIGPADSSERGHLLEMLPGLPRDALIAADAGFVGYEYAKAILDSGRHLLLRVGSNVRLLKKLAYARESSQTVYLWPDREARQKQPPLVLRLVETHNGKHPVFLVTSLSTQASDQQVLELYRRRWGIEVFYRHLKQTFQRRKLRSGKAEHARLEMEWSMAGLWAMALHSLVQLRRVGVPPRRLSVAKMLRAFRRVLRDYRHPLERTQSLCQQLGRALIDPYDRRCKTSRDYPRKKQERPPGPPRITKASPTQIQLAAILQREISKKGLTA
jgi:hypothetical protein